LTVDTIRDAPKVLLHDHLDGGLRPATVIELADAAGYRDLPSTDAMELGGWFLAAAHSGSLVRYLETFGHTVGVMQTADALVRVAAECAEDLAADGVVYAEVRFAPELHVEAGLELDAVVEAVIEGFRVGTARAAEQGRRIRVGCLLTAMRHAARSREIAELAVRYRDLGVVGFDIAGAEYGVVVTADSRVVAHDVGRAERVDRGARQCVNRIGIRDVGADTDRLHALCGQTVDQ
jgi:adenosine deaminase